MWFIILKKQHKNMLLEMSQQIWKQNISTHLRVRFNAQFAIWADCCPFLSLQMQWFID